MITNTYRQNIVYHLRIIFSSPSALPPHLFSTFELYFFTPNRPPSVDGLRQAWPHSRRLCVFFPRRRRCRERDKTRPLPVLASVRSASAPLLPSLLPTSDSLLPGAHYFRVAATANAAILPARPPVRIQLLQTDASSIFRACPSYSFSRSPLISPPSPSPLSLLSHQTDHLHSSQPLMLPHQPAAKLQSP